MREDYHSYQRKSISKTRTDHDIYYTICGIVAIHKAERNVPAKEYICQNSHAQYELKVKNRFSNTVNDGVHRTMMKHTSPSSTPQASQRLQILLET